MTHLHGPVPIDDDFYSERPFEYDLIGNVQAGRWVLLLGPRQHGKTSALIRLKRKLADVGTHVASVDLQTLPPHAVYGELVAWFANRVARELGLAASIEPTDDVSEALAVAVPNGKAPVVIIVDEASNIKNDDWRNSFYGQIRSMATASGDAADDDIAKRVRFVFAGTFRVERLVPEENSPFNTCEQFDTSDLALADVTQLAAKVSVDPAGEAAAAIVAEVGGQPYLVQRLLDTIDGSDDWKAALDLAIEELRSGHSDHIRHIFRKVLADDELVRIVSAVVRDGSTPFVPGDDDQRYLMVIGLLRANRNRLVFRNALYAHVASISPQFAVQPQVQGQAKAVIFAYPASAFSGMAHVELREIASSAQEGAVGAYQSSGNRLALVGYGNALEAVLLNYLLGQTPAQIAVANAACVGGGGYHVATDPKTWTLVNMMRGARAIAGQGGIDIPESLREWRNLVHPAVCLQNYRPDEDLVPEVVAAAGLFGIVLRDLI